MRTVRSASFLRSTSSTSSPAPVSSSLGQEEKIAHDIDEPVRISPDDLDIVAVLFVNLFFEGLGKALYRRKGGPQLVRDARNEIALDPFQLLHARDVVEDKHNLVLPFHAGGAAQERFSSDLYLFERVERVASRLIHQFHELGLSEGLPVKLPFHRRFPPYDRLQTRVAVHDDPFSVDHDEPFPEGIDDALQLGPLSVEFVEGVLRSPGSCR